MGEDLGPAEPPDPGRALVEADPETLTGLERVRRAILIARGTYAAPTVPVLLCGGEGGRAVTNSGQGHPMHLVMAGPTFTQPAQPVHPRGLLGWKVRRACRKRGGHWWHPADPMIAWFCCQCGAERDGMPKDGT